jgi:tetratricopeptide (TPR) repeat protein
MKEKIQSDARLAGEQSLGDSNDLAAAIAKYRQLVVNNPDRPEIYANLGSLYARQAKWQEAIACYQQAIELAPEFAGAYRNLARVLTQTGNLQKAADCWYRALNLEPDWATAKDHYTLGKTLWTQKQLERAAHCYRQAIQLQSNYWEAYEQLASVLQQQQKWEEAIAVYRQIKQLNPDFVPAYLQLGSIFLQQQQYSKAIDNYHRALKIAPDSSNLQRQAIDGYWQAINAYAEATAQYYYQFGKLLRSKGNFTEAIQAYQQAIELNPHFAAVYIDLQYTPVSSKQLEQVIDFYRRIVQNHSNLPIAWGNLGDALTEQGNIKEAISCYQTGCYQRVISFYPQLAQLDWQEKKENGPDFIIIGAAKCGTSSLFNYLSHHPQILFPHKKELDFFWKNFDKGIDWYLAQFPAITDRPDFITGEATPNYLRFPLAAQRIKNCFPHVKLIVLLRNPIERAVSWHYHKINSGLATGTIEDAIATEMKQLENWHETDFINTGYRNPDNLLSSLYLYQLKVWIDLFGREQLLILQSEDLYNNPDRVMERVFSFLNISVSKLSQYPKINAGSYNSINDGLRRTLANYFQPYNQLLEEYLEMTFTWD